MVDLAVKLTILRWREQPPSHHVIAPVALPQGTPSHPVPARL